MHAFVSFGVSDQSKKQVPCMEQLSLNPSIYCDVEQQPCRVDRKFVHKCERHCQVSVRLLETTGVKVSLSRLVKFRS